ncbi:MAG TPA: hypothetical protein PLT07_06130, partial [Trueperaceae bacterium]|nr:hypothetical protein [Trueperaceae bacterium]
MSDQANNAPTTVMVDQLEDTPIQRGKAWKRFRRNPLAIVGLVMVAVFVLLAIFAPVLTELPRSCLRDLNLSAATQHDYRDPTKAVFWKAIVNPPASCFTIARFSFSTQPADAAS